ncbi:MAG: hypothetical protein R8G66_21910 [Cytophagales bacterium]|nr:hypothetical protein [Cytophagales bacterium]
MITTYQFSNKPGKFWPAALLLGFSGTLAISIAYAALTWYISNQILCMILCFLYFSMWALTLGKLAIATKCRNPSALRWTAVFFAIICWHVNWIVFLDLIGDGSINGPSFIALFSNPGMAYQQVADLANTGRFTYNEEGLNATLHGAIWIGEAVVMLLLCPLSVTGSLSGKVFCENCGNWIDDDGFEYPLMQSEQGTTISQDPNAVIYKNKNDFLEVNPEKIPNLLNWQYYREIMPTSYVKVNIQQCEQCHQTSTVRLDVIDVRITEDERDYSNQPIYNHKNTKESTSKTGKHFLISNQLYGHFLKKKAAFDDKTLNPWVAPLED